MKRIVPVEVTTCVVYKRSTYVADFLPEPEITIRTVTLGDDTVPLRSLTLCEEDMAPYKALFALAAEQGLPPEDTSVPEKRNRAKGGDCRYCGKKGYNNILSHYVAVHPEEATEHCNRTNPQGKVCEYPVFTERSKNRHLKMTHGVQ